MMEHKTPFSKEQLVPQEETLEIFKRKGSLRIGIPKETAFQEKRICLTPDAIEVLVLNGHQVLIESSAGMGANFTDREYSEAGAEISKDVKKVYGQHIILKIAPPSLEQIKLIKPNSVLVSALQINTQSEDYFKTLAKKKITCIAFDYIKDEHGDFPIVRTLSEIAGTTSILVAAELLSSINGGPGLMMGGVSGVKPTQVLILGAGTVGEYASKSAAGLGASVQVFDASVTKLRQLNNRMIQRVYTSTINPKEFKKALIRCDVLIGAIRSINSARTPNIVTEEMVQSMKKGSVIIDISIDFGGCIETSEITTHKHPTFSKYDVIHYGVTNIASRVSQTSTKALSNFFLPYLISVGEEGGFQNLIKRDLGLRNGVYIYKGIHTNQTVAQWFGLNFNDINLLMF